MEDTKVTATDNKDISETKISNVNISEKTENPMTAITLLPPGDRIHAEIEMYSSENTGLAVRAKNLIRAQEIIIECSPFVKITSFGDNNNVFDSVEEWAKAINQEAIKLQKEDKVKFDKIAEAFGELYPRDFRDATKNMFVGLFIQYKKDKDEPMSFEVVLQAAKIKLNMLPLPTGFGLFRYASKVNHSCDPNAVCFVKDDLLVIKTLRDIQAGEEITIPYKFTAFHEKVTERRILMNGSHGFECLCLRCVAESKKEKYTRTHKEILTGIISTQTTCFFTGCRKPHKKKFKCSTCKMAHYCCKTHLDLDQKRSHGEICKMLL